MAKNHYVSQLIIRRFSNAINTFDAENKRLVRDRKSHNVFYRKDIYSDEVEKQLAQELEQPFARLVDEKVIGKDTIILDRRELLLIKRFLLLDSIRTYSADGFYEILSGFSANCERYAKLCSGIDINIMMFPSIKQKREEMQTLYMQAMHLFIECPSIDTMPLHPFVTREAYCWAKALSDMYVVFWDSADNQEFLLTDNGMVSEYEPSHNLFAGLDLSKHSYLQHKMTDKSISETHRVQYMPFIAKNQICYENVNIFSLSATRSIVLAHPFFRLYSNNALTSYSDTDETITLEVPSVWPSCFETREAFTVPENRYVEQGKHSMGDIFVYKPCKISEYDTILVNVIALRQKLRYLGFNDIDKVIDSLACAQMEAVINHHDVWNNDGLENLKKFIDHLLADKYNYIFNEYKGKKWNAGISPFDYIDYFTYMTYRDTIQNKYVLEYLLTNESMVKSMNTNFGFMGNPEQRLNDLKHRLTEIEKAETTGIVDKGPLDWDEKKDRFVDFVIKMKKLDKQK